MCEDGKTQVTPAEDPQLERVFDYTKFHILIYLSLGGAIAGSKLVDEWDDILKWPFVVFFLCMVAAGCAAGVIASSTLLFATYSEFAEKKLGPWKLELFKFKTWAMIEHTAFWLGILVPSFYLMFFHKAVHAERPVLEVTYRLWWFW